MNDDLSDLQMREITTKLTVLARPSLAPAARQRIWRKAYAQANIAVAKPLPKSRLTLPFLRLLASSLMAVALLLTSAVWASTQSLPGDVLYPLSRGFETVQLALVPASQRPQLELQLLDRRALEVQQLLQRERLVPPEIIVEISTTVDRMANTPESFDGAAAVEAHLALQEETLRLVMTQYPEYRVAALAFESVTTARLSLGTLLTPVPAATIINTSTPSPTPTLTPTPSPSPTLTPSPTPTPSPTSTLSPTPTSEPELDQGHTTPTPPGVEDGTPPGWAPPGLEDKAPPGLEDKGEPPGQDKRP